MDSSREVSERCRLTAGLRWCLQLATYDHLRVGLLAAAVSADRSRDAVVQAAAAAAAAGPLSPLLAQRTAFIMPTGARSRGSDYVGGSYTVGRGSRWQVCVCVVLICVRRACGAHLRATCVSCVFARPLWYTTFVACELVFWTIFAFQVETG